jgi:hypothetical protein
MFYSGFWVLGKKCGREEKRGKRKRGEKRKERRKATGKEGFI